jgi:transglutaminase-like putative cysteine protease
VTGVAPLVDEHAGTLIVPGRRGPVEYGLSWWEPDVDPDTLYDAGIDPAARSGLGDLGVVPPRVADLAREAAHGIRPSFRTALLLEDFLSDNYRVASGGDLPTGNGWPQLSRFLLETKRGTSEQFAAAYVALARILGLPARIVVGYRAPEGTGRVTVHNKDVLAWPEVAVAGVGWVPLDPSGAAENSRASSGLAGVTDKARAKLPPPEELVDPDVPDDQKDTHAGSGPGFSVPVAGLALGAAGLVVAWLVGVPFSVAVRRLRRRRLGGARAVVGAWAEARDRLRAHGVPITVGMTVRDLAAAAEPLGEQVVAGLHRLAYGVDEALWSVAGPDAATVDEAWNAVRLVRRGLARRPLGARLRAALLLPGRPRGASLSVPRPSGTG